MMRQLNHETETMPTQPSGSVTFLFTDLEGSTKLWERYPEAMRSALARHDALLSGAIASNQGYVFKTIGDAFCAAFASAPDGVKAAVDAQRALAREPWGETGPLRARMALHTGEPEARDGDYFGQPVNRVARLMSAGHGNQILLSDATRQHIFGDLPEQVHLRDLKKHRLKDLSRPQQVYQLVSSDWPTNLKRLKSLPSPFTGGVAALGTSMVGLVSFRAQTRTSAEGLGPGLLSPPSLYLGLKGLVIDLSTVNEYLLLGVGLLLLVLMLAIGVARWREVRKETALEETEPGRLAEWLVNQRTLAFLAVAALTVLGAYGYQQYLWRVALPIPDDAIGFALTREAAAASFQEQLADTLFAQGQTKRIVVRQLPVKFDARDTADARSVGNRIGAEAVIIYRVDDDAPDGTRQYIAYVVFTDPNIGLTVGDSSGAAPSAAGAGSNAPPIQIKEGVDVPVLRTETLDDLVNAAAGIIAYDNDRLREAIKHLELAVPRQPDAPNAGIVEFYLGNAYSLDGQTDAAIASLERAAAFYETQRQTTGALGPQDALILVKTYTERGRIAALRDDWDTALAWYQKGLTVREDLLARASGLERPSDVRATYARLYTLMTDAYRAQGKTEDQEFWRQRAEEEIEALAADSDSNDPYPLVQQSGALVFLGNCVAATEALTRAIALDPDSVRAYSNQGIVYFLQGRNDAAEHAWQQIIALRSENTTARMLTANVLVLRGLGDDYFESSYLLGAEDTYRQIIELDPTNLNAHEQIAALASLRAQAAVLDSTALSTADDLSFQKSQVVWSRDPARRQVALDALETVIQERRTLSAELQPGDPSAEAAVATAYAERLTLLYSVVLDEAIAAMNRTAKAPAATPEGPAASGSPVATPVTSTWSPDQAMGEQILDDIAQIREWTDKVFANPSASQEARLQAWAARVGALEREWSWAAFFVEDEAKATALEEEYRHAVIAAVAFGDSAEIGINEITSLRNLYFAARFVAVALDGDELAASSYDAKISLLTLRERGERGASTGHLVTTCREEQERSAGDEFLATDALDAALPHYEAAIAANPAHVPALAVVGEIRFRQGNVPDAISVLEEAAAAAPDDARVWADLGLYHLIAGDADARDAAYDHLLTILTEQRPQERMAALRVALHDIADQVAERPAIDSQVVALVPRFTIFLDGMADEGEGSYQYPALYAILGRLALQADDPKMAEALLRQALALDPHQPVARADLVIAVGAQSSDATDEIDAALEETRATLWSETIDFQQDRLLTMMEQAAQRHQSRFPDRTAGLAPFLAAIADERQGLK